MKPIKTILFTILSIALISCVSQETFKTISNDGISIQHPTDWEYLEFERYSIAVKEKAKSTEYSVLCNFIVEIDSNYKYLADYIEQYRVKMRSNKYLKNWEFESDNKTTFKGFEAHEIVATFSGGGFELKTKVILVQLADKIVNLSTTSSITNYPKNEELTNGIFNSVEFN